MPIAVSDGISSRSFDTFTFSMGGTQVTRKYLFAAFVLGIVSIFAGMAGCSSDSTLTSPAASSVIEAAPQIVDVGALGSGSSCQDLVAGQSINAGSVCYDDIDTDND